MITFQQFLNEKFYGFKSKGSNSPNMLMAKKSAQQSQQA